MLTRRKWTGRFMGGDRVSNPKVAGLTLREKVREAERLSRELIQHLESGFLPKVQDLRRLAKTGTTADQIDEVADASIRTSSQVVLKSFDYSAKLQETLEEFLEAIEADLHNITEQGE
ncbi:MAG: hypothetical protein R3C01_00815 [Planctomycetaceae bacterium]